MKWMEYEHTTYNLFISKSLQSEIVTHRYVKLCILLIQTVWIWNIKS